MKLGNGRLLCLAATALVAFIFPGFDAEASCTTLVQMTTGSYPYQNYVQPIGWPSSGTSSDPGGTGLDHKGVFWQPGRRAIQGNGTYGPEQWWVRFASPYGWYFQVNMTVPGIAGCPGTPPTFGGDATAPAELITCVFDLGRPKLNGNRDSYYYCSRQAFDKDVGIQFDQGPMNPFESWGTGDLVPIPRPRITRIDRIGTGLFVTTIELDDVAAGFQSGTGMDPYATITGYKICKTQAPEHPSRDVADWDCSGPAIPTQVGGITVVDYEAFCKKFPDRLSDLYLATQLVFDNGSANGGYESEYVSRAIAFECGAPTLAEPHLPAERGGVRKQAVRNR